jgi:hypothetical protein
MYVLYKCNGMNAYTKMRKNNVKELQTVLPPTFEKSLIFPELALYDIVACAEYYILGLHKSTAKR